MPALTRIKNNQILDSTIYANAKIVPGSIVGSLFNSNITVTSDFTITGNLTVQGASTYMTVASTNTYVNDPLIVINNAFSGTNTYDLGFVFNRGTLQNTALIWNEFNKEFRLVGTTETGTTYGNINQSNYANLSLGNLSVQYIGNVTSIIASGNINQTGTGTLQGASFEGNVALNGPYVTTSQGLINFLDTGVTTVNVFGAATAIDLGATSGTLTINNPTVVGTQSTQNLYNTTATTLNFGGAATTFNIGATSGTLTINNPTVVGTQSTQALYNTTATTLNFAGAATTLNVGASTGTATLNNQVLALPNAFALRINGANPTLESTDTGTLKLFNANVTAVSAFGAATDITIGATTGTANIKNLITNVSGQLNVLVGTDSTTTSTGAIVVTGGVGISGNLNVGGNALVNGPTTINNTLSTTGVTRLYNTTNTAQTHDTGALQVDGGASISKDLWVGGNVYAGNIFGTSQQIITVQDPLLYLEAGNTYPYNYDIGIYSNFVGPDSLTGTGNVYQHTSILRDNSDNTWKFVSNIRGEPTAGGMPIDSDTRYDPVRAGNLTLVYTQESTSATTGALQVGGGAGIAGNIFHTGTRLETSASNYLFASTPTTVDAFKAATDIEIGATSGTVLINNPTVVGSQTTQALYNTVTQTLNFARAANITMGHTDGTTTLQGNANIRAVTQTTTFTNGALVVAGGGGFADNVAIAKGHQFLVGTELANKVLVPNATAQFFSNVAGYSQINQQNVNNGSGSSSDFVATADNGDDFQGYIDLGINSSTFSNVAFSVAKANDGYLYVFGNTSTGGGNLAIGTGQVQNDIIFFTGGTTSDLITMRINDNTATFQPNVHITIPGWTTSLSNGGFVVDQGAAIGANLRVGSDAIFNYTQSALGNFTIRTSGSTAGLIYNIANQSLILNGPGYASNVTPIGGATLAVRATDSMLIPVGTTAQRPSNTGNVDVTGMLRFNVSANNLEWYNGSEWAVPGASTTIITDQQINGDGTSNVFILSGDSTTNSTIVSINGVLQYPITAYAVSGNVLTFTEAPAVGDVIDVRVLTTTTTISSLGSANGFMLFDASDGSGTYANITGGVSGPTVRFSLNAEGIISLTNDTKIAINNSAYNIAANNTPYVVDTWTQTRYTSAKYIVTAKNDATTMESYEAMVITDQTGNAYISTYGIVNTGSPMGVLTANVLGGNVRLYYTSTSSAGVNANVRVYTTYIV